LKIERRKVVQPRMHDACVQKKVNATIAGVKDGKRRGGFGLGEGDLCLSERRKVGGGKTGTGYGAKKKKTRPEYVAQKSAVRINEKIRGTTKKSGTCATGEGKKSTKGGGRVGWGGKRQFCAKKRSIRQSGRSFGKKKRRRKKHKQLFNDTVMGGLK